MKKDRDAGTARYSFIKELLLEYKEGNSGRLRSIRRRMELDVSLRWIGAYLNLDSENNDELCVLKFRMMDLGNAKRPLVMVRP